jgi:hypothetical protein
VFRGFNSGYKLVLYLLSSGNAYAHFGPHDAWGNAVVEYILFTYPFGGEIMARIDSSSVGRPAFFWIASLWLFFLSVTFILMRPVICRPVKHQGGAQEIVFCIHNTCVLSCMQEARKRERERGTTHKTTQPVTRTFVRTFADRKGSTHACIYVCWQL